MKNFKLIERDIDTDFILQELDNLLEQELIPTDFGLSLRQKNLEFYRKRYENYIDHHEMSGWKHLVGAFNVELPEIKQLSAMNSRFLYKTPIYEHFPKTLQFLKDFAKKNNAKLERVIFAYLKEGGEVLPHIDKGEYFKFRDRYHLVLTSREGSEFLSGEEKQIFKEKELWWFANKELHAVKNLNSSPRLHLIFDLLPKKHFSLVQKIKNYFLNFFLQKYFEIYGIGGFTKLIKTSLFFRKIILS
jgi:hypothetical protein